MTLPAPNLDDRKFQAIVNEAKQRIHQLCPEWTDHNVSDPGVALIELYAWMTEMMLYRMNQVPDRLYVKFLELVGIELYGSSAASTDLLFRLTAPQAETVVIPAGTQVSTAQVGEEEPVVFMTDATLQIEPPTLVSCVTRTGQQQQHTEHFDELRREAARVVCFSSLLPGDAFFLGFSNSHASNVLRLHIVTGVEGAGVNPDDPPLLWEAWTGKAWVQADMLADTTKGLNCPEGGDIELLLPDQHQAATILVQRAHWLRCKLVPLIRKAQKGYRKSPELISVEVVSVGGAVRASHAEEAPSEILGTSTGAPSQAFSVLRTPVLPRTGEETVQILVSPPGGGRERGEDQLWTEVPHFGLSTENDRVFTWSSVTGEIRFGPRLIERTGKSSQHGAVPTVDSQIRVTGYRHGGGRRGNVSAGRLTVVRTAISFVAGVTNRRAARGGVDAESLQDAKLRGPLTLRSGDRAVTVEDFERLTLQSSRAVKRARCLPPVAGGPVRILVVPSVDVPPAALSLQHLELPKPMVSRITTHLDERRLLTTRIQIDEPAYQGLRVNARVLAVAGIRPESIRERALTALYDFINPIVGGHDGQGWPFGHPLNDGDISALLRGVHGVAAVDRVTFSLTNRKGEVTGVAEMPRVVLGADELPLSYPHEVEVIQ